MDAARRPGATSMTGCARNLRRFSSRLILASLLFAYSVLAQNTVVDRQFPQSKAEVEKALKAVKSSEAGHLPSLEGFAQPGAHPLDHYQRGYYQATVEVSSVPAGGARVHVTVKVTAWYNDPKGAHSGYELLTSNGRLEADLLDQLSERLGQA